MIKTKAMKYPILLIVFADIFSFSLLCFYRKTVDFYMIAAGFLVILLIITTNRLIIKKVHGDEYLFLISAMLASLGFVMIYRLDRMAGLRQVVWFAGGIFLFLFSSLIFKSLKNIEKLSLYYVLLALVLFLITLFFAGDVNGSSNWISIAGISIQPSEPIKVIFIVILACLFSRAKQYIYRSLRFSIIPGSFGAMFLVTLIAYVFIGFLVLQREWGTSVLIFLIYISMIFVFENNIKLYALNGIFAIAGGVGGYYFLSHIKTRVDMWINPWQDISGKGYQITQSMFAIASGGFFGTGVGLGRPDIIPAAKTDFIFSAICEEMGIFGGMAVILMFFILCYRGFKIVLTTHNLFDKATALGITMMFGIQTFIIIGGVIKLIPMTGITLPFISYGGSSLTSSFVALGILQAISAGTVREIGEAEDAEK